MQFGAPMSELFRAQKIGTAGGRSPDMKNLDSEIVVEGTDSSAAAVQPNKSRVQVYNPNVLAGRGATRRVGSRREFRRGREAKAQLYWTYCKVWRQSPRRKDQARRRDELRHGLLARSRPTSPALGGIMGFGLGFV